MGRHGQTWAHQPDALPDNALLAESHRRRGAWRLSGRCHVAGGNRGDRLPAPWHMDNHLIHLSSALTSGPAPRDMDQHNSRTGKTPILHNAPKHAHPGAAQETDMEAASQGLI